MMKRENREKKELWNHKPFITYCEYKLKKVIEQSRAVERVILATIDGIEIVAYPEVDHDVSERLGAIGSSMLALGRSSAQELDLDACRSIEIESEKGRIWISGVNISGNQELILLVQSPTQAVHGEMLYYANQLKGQIEEFVF